ncbi:hypothetical protein [Chryseobacterium viscerum]|uniref:Right-handed parallel beta-helix repeat-containing protein n=1 Tax=Chryseobacterium viscerum TaxID=1037377 RepID=A0A5N4BJ17_9FLAO|nr:hypothetical protein [Chryseobacterium viscerum]KAB1228442.1 hypothetical protein F8D52_22465 [Chryseobacterium viscerum]
MSNNLNTIKGLLPDNTTREISEKDLRDSFEFTYEDIEDKLTVDKANLLYLALSDFVVNGKIKADKIEALALSELIVAVETSLSEFMANNIVYEYQIHDFIAIPDGSGNFSLYIFRGGNKTFSGNYIPLGLSRITIPMVEGLQNALNSKLNSPTITGKFILNSTPGTSSWNKISPAVNYLLFWNAETFIQSSAYYDGNNFGIGLTNPSELLHINGRVRTKAVVLDNNSEEIPGQITYFNRRFRGTDVTGTARNFMYFDFSDYKELWQSFTNPQKNEMRSFLNISDGYKGVLRRNTATPSISGLYRLLELGTYPNLSPAEDENGNSIVITAIDGKFNDAYFDGSKWFLSKISVPEITAEQIFDPSNNIKASTMKATADRYDVSLNVLDYFLNPYKISGNIDISMPRPNENKNAFLNTSWQQYATPGSPIHNGVIDISELDINIIEISIQGNQLDIAGAGIVWLGLQNSLTGAKVQLLKGSVAKGKYKFQIDKQAGYDKIYYSRVESDTILEYKKVINLPVTTNSVQKYVDETGISITQAMSDKFDRTLDVLNSFVYPKGETDWEDIDFSNIEYQGIIYNTGGLTEPQPAGAVGLIYAKDLTGVSSLRITALDMDKFGGTIAWWLGYRADNTFDVLRYGVLASGSASMKLDPQYTYYRYSRPLAGAKMQKRMVVDLPPEKDSVFKRMSTAGSGYSGILDLGSIGVKTTNTAAINTAIINLAIEEEAAKVTQRRLQFPPGYFAVNEILLGAGTIISGADKGSTVLFTNAGSVAKRIFYQPDGQVRAGEISNFAIDANNCTEGAIFINNTFGHKIMNCAIFTKAQYAISHTAALYHHLSDIYFDGGDVQLLATTTQKMANNLVRYDRLYCVKAVKNNVVLNGGSNFVFNSCNFEDSGISGDETTGGVRAINLSANGEGVDVTFNNCWSEGVRGGYIYKFENCKGSSVIRDCMLGKGGNGTGTIANAIVNINSNLLLSGTTRFSAGSHFHPFPTNIRAVGGSTTVDNPHINIGTNNVGNFKIVQYSEITYTE